MAKPLILVIRAAARFTGPGEVEGGGFTVRARRIVIATGTAAAVPPIPGLDQVPFFTNETLFDNTVLPEHLIVIGGGPVGLEMAQAHRLLGSRVTVLEAAHILPKDDPELVALLRRQLEARTCWSPPGGGQTSRNSISTEPASSTTRKA